MIEYDCPNCGRHFMSPDSRGGLSRNCRGCGAQFRIAASSGSVRGMFGRSVGLLTRQLRQFVRVWQGLPGILAIVVAVVLMLVYGLSNTTPEARNFTGSAPAEAAALTEALVGGNHAANDAEFTMARAEPGLSLLDESVDAGEPVPFPEVERIGEEVEPPAIPASAVETVSISEIEALRETVARMQQTLDVFTETIATDLREENERLRELLALARNESGSSAYPVGSGKLRMPIEDRGELLEAPIEVADPEPAMTIVREWGRSPELAARLPGDFSSLKGMIIVVPYGRSDEELIRLAKELRNEYALYDNVNIEVFENMAAAESFSESGTSSMPEARVLSLSKFASSGRSVNLLFRGDAVTVIP